MATPKFDRISVEFSRRVADPVAAAATNGTVLSADARTTYVNKALHKLFNDVWGLVQADVQKFLNMFPELAKHASATFNTTGQIIMGNNHTYWDKASPHMDLYKLITVVDTTNSLLVKLQKETLYGRILNDELPQFTGSATNPIGVLIGDRLSVFNASQTALALLITYIQLPNNPTDGSFLTQNGSYDSPYSDHWNSKIAMIAEQMFKIDTQQTS